MSHGKHMITTERPDLIDANRSDVDSTSHPLDEHRRGQRPELLSSPWVAPEDNEEQVDEPSEETGRH
jgi:hypothetical protein